MNIIANVFQRCLLSPSSLPSPLDARKNFLIDSAREYTVFSSFLLVSFFPARLPARKEEGKWSCRAYRSPYWASIEAETLVDYYYAPLSFFSLFLILGEIGVGVNIEFVLSEPRTSSFSRVVVSRQLFSATFSHSRRRGGGEGEEEGTRDIARSLSLSPSSNQLVRNAELHGLRLPVGFRS